MAVHNPYARKLNEAERLIQAAREEEERQRLAALSAREAEQRAAEERRRQAEAEQRAAQQQQKAEAESVAARRARLQSTLGASSSTPALRFTRRQSIEALSAQQPVSTPSGPTHATHVPASTPVPVRFGAAAAAAPSTPAATPAQQQAFYTPAPSARAAPAATIAPTPYHTPMSTPARAYLNQHKQRDSFGQEQHKHHAVPASEPRSRAQTDRFRRRPSLEAPARMVSTPRAASLSSSSAARPVSMAAAPAAVANACTICHKAVFFMDQQKIDGKLVHAHCMRCETCQKRVSPGNYASHAGVLYCKPHFKQLFLLKGNYDEGFGGVQRKMDFVTA